MPNYNRNVRANAVKRRARDSAPVGMVVARFVYTNYVKGEWVELSDALGFQIHANPEFTVSHVEFQIKEEYYKFKEEYTNESANNHRYPSRRRNGNT